MRWYNVSINVKEIKPKIMWRDVIRRRLVWSESVAKVLVTKVMVYSATAVNIVLVVGFELVRMTRM